MSDQVVIVIGGTATALLTGVTAWISKRGKAKVEQGIRPHLETLSERVAGVEGRLGGIEQIQQTMLDHLLKKD